LGVLLRHLPRESATIRELGGDAVVWDEDTHLLASIVDLLALGNWQRQGRANAQRPKPIPRPGAKPAEDRLKTRAMSAAEWDARREARLNRGKS
jgi:hypothetical protein